MSRTPRPLPDRKDRAVAATDFTRNLVVTAGAGTGKTALLVERALNLVAGAGVKISELAAITFTEKAAAELRERLANGLVMLQNLAATGADSKQPGWEKSAAGRSWSWLRTEAKAKPGQVACRAIAALSDLDAAAVTTIHAFCSEILRTYPAEAGVDPLFTVDEGAGFRALFDPEWDRFLLEELGASSPRIDLWNAALRAPGALPMVKELAASLAGFALPGQAVEPGARYEAAPAGRLLEPLLRPPRDAALDLLGHTSDMNPRMSDFLAASAELLGTAMREGPEAMSTAAAPISLERYREMGVPSPGAKMTGAEPDRVKEIARECHGLVKRLARIDERLVASLADAALPLATRVRERMLRSGFVSFDGLLRLTRDLLAGSPGVRRALAARYRTILVDEFQDTDPLQYEILFFLAEEEKTGPATDPWNASLAPGRLFIVGDPKQSIYRFRGADMAAYTRAVERIVPDEKERLKLSASFRSPEEIVEPINRLFGNWIGPGSPMEERFEPRYERIESASGPAGSGEPCVEIWSVAREGNVAERRRGEAAAIAGWILENPGIGPRTGEKLKGGHVAILLRALTHADLYAQALRRAGIPYVVEGGRGFYERREVADLIAFLRAAANPADAAAILAVARSPLGAVPDEELARYAGGGGRFGRRDEDAARLERHPNLARTLSLLDRFRCTVAGRPVDRVISSALEETPLLVLHGACFEGSQRAANLRKLVGRAGELARRGLSLEETLHTLEEEHENERAEGESPLADETVDAVRILSVHKAKGLEYPVVIVPDVGRESKAHRFGRGGESAWVAAEGDDAGTGWLGVRLQDGRTNAAHMWLDEMNRRHEAAEEKRIFYVACTRARERLILVNSNTARRAPWRDALEALDYIAAKSFPQEGELAGGTVTHRRLEPADPPVAGPGEEIDPEWVSAAKAHGDLLTSAVATAAPPVRRPSQDSRADGDEIPESGEAGIRTYAAASAAQGALARLAGMVIHAALERWDFAGDETLRKLAEREAERALFREEDSGTSPLPEREVLLEECREILDRFLASPIRTRLVEATILGREVPILLHDETAAPGGGTWRGYCDLIYRDVKGTVVVADYKTDRVEGDPGMHAARYRDQLEVYLRALRVAMPGARIRSEILLLRAGEAITLESA